MPHLFLILLPFLFLIAVAAQSICSPSTCGTVKISYPFWRISNESTFQFCGYQGFGINCSIIDDQNVSQITLGDDSYYVQEINYETRSFVLNDYDVSLVAPVHNKSCPRVRHNISFGNLPLDYTTSTVNLSFHFNCNGSPMSAIGIPCLGNVERNTYVSVNPKEQESEWDEYSCTGKVVTTVFVADYTVFSKNLSTEFGRVLEEGFELEWGTMVECKKCEKSDGHCGLNQTTGILCFCPDGTIRNNYCKGSHINLTTKLVIGAGFASLSIVIVVVMYLFASLKHKTEEDKNIEAFVMHYGSLSTQRYTYWDIKKMTNSFQVKLGQGGFGQVFKGKLSDGRLVAVKLLNSSKANGQEFINEVASIGRTSHVNIVTLLGFCFQNKERALVYEYMSNGSLEKFIHSHAHMGTSEHIGVTKLYEIALGVARGLDYLHRGCNTRILHLDIKPHNILLDEDFCPKIADFGLAKLYSRRESIVSMLEARGTIGYIAPEVFNQNFGGVSHKADVYSYGMLILEMVGRRKNVDAGVGSGRTSEIYFPKWIYNRLQKDEFLLDCITTTEENDYAKKMTIVGLWCIQPAPNQRPSINEVIEMLEGRLEALEVPPKPFFSSPPRSPATIYSTSGTESML